MVHKTLFLGPKFSGPGDKTAQIPTHLPEISGVEKPCTEIYNPSPRRYCIALYYTARLLSWSMHSSICVYKCCVQLAIVPALKTHMFFFQKSVFRVSGGDISLSPDQWRHFRCQTMRLDCSAKGQHRRGGGQAGAPCRTFVQCYTQVVIVVNVCWHYNRLVSGIQSAHVTTALYLCAVG